MSTPHVPYQIPELAGKPFRPANGTEGYLFCEAFCEHCVKESDCQILTGTLALSLDSPQYPREWVFDPDGWPVCTAF